MTGPWPTGEHACHPPGDAVAERLFGAVLGTVDLLSVFLGDRLGWYRSLAEDGPATPPQLAGRTGTDARYAREWLEQQAVTGLLHLDSDSAAHYDVAFAFECVHDMPRPVEVLTAVRKSLTPGAPLIVMDEAVAESFAPDGDEVERLMYGYSIFICLPDGRSSRPSVATGTVLRPSRLREYAEAAGFRDFEVLPITDFSLFRFYRLS